MHCHERGFVLASIWNTQQGLVELAFDQTQLRNDSLAAANSELKVRDDNADAAVGSVMWVSIPVPGRGIPRQTAHKCFNGFRIPAGEAGGRECKG